MTIDDAPFPIPLSDYPRPQAAVSSTCFGSRIDADPLNAIATAIFLLAVVHTFFAARFTDAAHAPAARRDAGGRRGGSRADAERRRRAAALSRRGRSDLRAVGHSAGHRDRRLSRLGRRRHTISTTP